jgi:CRISPR system Cascade subunit CasE
MILSRLFLNPASRLVQRSIADAQLLHKVVMSAFGQSSSGAARAEMAILYRLEAVRDRGRLILYVQSRLPPEWHQLDPGFLLDLGDELENPGTKNIDNVLTSVHTGSRLSFRLRANTTRKIQTKSTPEGQKRNGKRVALRGDEQKVHWLTRRGERGGFRLLKIAPGIVDVRVVKEPGLGGGHPSGPLTFAATLFDGTLEVFDPALFRSALESGIGPGKAFGFGLLSIRPVASPRE